jgi:hypothetical protein
MTDAQEQLERIEALDPEQALAIYQAVESKRQSQDQMMWQVPALGLTAQAFLLTVALSPSSSGLARGLAAGLGFVAAVAGVQLLLKHRYLEWMLSHWLERFEKVHGLPALAGRPNRTAPFAFQGQLDPWSKTGANPLKIARKVLNRPSSAYFWVGMLSVFAAADLFVLVLAVIGSDLLG